jgi:light-regulated signal transduction histidine kinase (bacteriophytochrome)
LEQEIRQIVRDRTAELEERTRELERRSIDLQRSNADLLQFAYVASHDLQEPLRTIASYVGLLGHRYNGKLDESAEKYIEFAISGADRMQTLIGDLLTYSKAGTQELERRPVSMNAVVNVVLENLAASREQTGAQIAVEALPAIAVDEKQLIQVFQNLIGNAIKFHKPDEAPEICITASKRDSAEWIFAVKDNGIGFDEEYTERIFQMFQRLHGIGKYPGTGIGLAICRRIIEQHGGRLWATSSPGVGSTFFFSLPASEKVT